MCSGTLVKPIKPLTLFNTLLAVVARDPARRRPTANGKEAVEALRRQAYDLILMDVHMPEMDGLQATTRICQEWPKDQKPEIVALTASVLPQDVQDCLSAGTDGVLTKPVSIDDLRSLLQKFAAR